MKSLIIKLKSKIAGIKNKLLKIEAESHDVAMGYAMGIFLAASPFIGIKVPIAIALSFLFKWNKIAAIIGIFHINPLTGPLFYGLSFVVGKFVTGIDLSVDFSSGFSIKMLGSLLTSNIDGFVCLLIGGIIIGLPLSVAAYFITRSIFYRAKTLKTNVM